MLALPWPLVSPASHAPANNDGQNCGISDTDGGPWLQQGITPGRSQGRRGHTGGGSGTPADDLGGPGTAGGRLEAAVRGVKELLQRQALRGLILCRLQHHLHLRNSLNYKH